MAAPKELLPPVNSSETAQYDHSNDSWFKQRYAERSVVKESDLVRQYHTREGYGDGQYPLGMGRKTLPVSVDEHGNVTLEAIVKQNVDASKIVYSQHKDLVPTILKDEIEKDEEVEQLEKEIEETTLQTKAELEKIVNRRLSASQPKNMPSQSSDSKFIKYKPSQQSTAFNSGAKERLIRLAEMHVDPLDPPKFKHKRVPRASGSPPVPVMQSPPRPVTVKDQQDWKIPPAISNWKNPKGYTIPLDKRMAVDGRGLQEVQINDSFSKLSESLYVAEQKAREAVTMRAKVQKDIMMKEKERKEQDLLVLAQRARSERTGGASLSSNRAMVDDGDMRVDYVSEKEKDNPRETKEEREKQMERERIREERRKERERERRLEAKDIVIGKKSKITRDRDRDISEKLSLGMASTIAGNWNDVMYDQRLFNQEKGIDSGFVTDDQYNVYDKGLFTAQSTHLTLHRPKKDTDSDMYGDADERIGKIMKTDRFKPDKSFAGISEKAVPRERPVEFEREAEEADPFGLDKYLTDMKKGI